MKNGWVGNRRLQAIVKSDAAILLPEVIQLEDSHVKDVFDDWDAGTVSGSVLVLESGGATIFPVDTEVVAEVANDGAFLTDLTHIAPYQAVLISWTAAGSEDIEIHTLVARMDPRRDGGQPKTVSVWEAQLFRVVRVMDEAAGGGYEFAPISAAVRVTASGEAAADFTFSFGSQLGGGYPVVGPPPDRGDALSSYPLTLVRIIGLQSDGSPANNVGWLAKTADSSATGLGYTAQSVGVTVLNNPGALEVGGAAYQVAVSTPYPEFQLKQSEYTAATITFDGGNEVPDLPGTGDLVIVARGELPSDSAITYEIDDGGGYVECVDGDVIGEDNTADGGEDLSGVSTTGPWDIRVTLTPSTAADLNAPTVREFGVERVVSTLLRGGSAEFRGGAEKVDCRDLHSEISAAELFIPKLGENDYRDYGSNILARSHIGEITVRIWVADRDGSQLNRKEWMLHSAWDVDDYVTTDTAHLVALISPLRRIHPTTIPPFVVSSGNNGTRTRTEVSGTLKAVYEELIDTMLAVAGRFRGPGVEDDTNTASKWLERSHGKEEVDRVAYLDGSAVVVIQGRICAVKVVRDGPGGDTPVAFFPYGSYDAIEFTPGFSSRTDEFFVRGNWNESGEFFEDEWRYFNAVAFTKLGGVGVNTTQELDEETARWITSQTLADLVGNRVPYHFATGQIIWRIRSHYAHPELTLGDVVAITTTRFVGRSPVSDAELRGRVSALAVVVGVNDEWGRDLELWVPSFDKIVPATGTVTRDGFDTTTERLLHRDTTSRSHTGDTTDTIVETVPVPALYPYKDLRVRLKWGFTGTAGTKALKARLNDGSVTGTVALYTVPAPTEGSLEMDFVVESTGTATSRSTWPVQGAETSLRWTPSNDITIENDLEIMIDLGDAADTAVLLESEVFVLEKAA